MSEQDKEAAKAQGHDQERVRGRPAEQRRPGTLLRGPTGALYFIPGNLEIFEIVDEREQERILGLLDDGDRKLLEEPAPRPDSGELSAGKATSYLMKTVALPATDAGELDLQAGKATVKPLPGTF
jgi:hypothetical protein